MTAKQLALQRFWLWTLCGFAGVAALCAGAIVGDMALFITGLAASQISVVYLMLGWWV